MILRRVVEHAKTQNWFAAALDFFIVVLGVFVALEVANWNQARQNRQEERRYYGQLLVDLRAIWTRSREPKSGRMRTTRRPSW